jgi:hypothetical protein
MSAQEQWHMLRAPSRIQAFINGLAFKDGIKQSQIATCKSLPANRYLKDTITDFPLTF